MVSFLLNFLNKEKKFPFFFVTPLIYAIGNSGEQILLAANKAKKQKKVTKSTNFALISL